MAKQSKFQQQKAPLHLRLTSDEWLKIFNRLDRSELGVFYFIKTQDPFGDRVIEVNSANAATLLGIHRTSVSRALKSLSQKGLISLEIMSAKVSIRISQKLVCMDAQEVCMDAQEVCMDAQEVCMDAQEVCMDAQEHNIDCVRDQTIPNLIKTNLDSLPPTPQRGKEREFGFQIENPEAISQPQSALLNQVESTQLTSQLLVEAIVPAAGQSPIKYDPALGIRPPRQKPKYRYPDGPWLNDAGQINEDFIRDRAALWRTGDTTASKSFGAMAIEDVISLVCGHYQRLENHAKLETDWVAYVAKNQRYVGNVLSRLKAGIEIPIEEQHKILQKAPALTAIPVEPAYGNAVVPNALAVREVPQLESVVTVSDDIWDAVETATQQEQAQFVDIPEGAVDAAMYTRTAKPEDAKHFRQLHEKATPLPIKSAEEVKYRTNALIASKGMPTISNEERQRMKEQEKLGRKLAHWNSLLQTGIPSVVADVQRQANAQGYAVIDGQISEVDF